MTARGRLHLLTTQLADHPGKKYQDLFAACLLCGACENICPRHIRAVENIVAARSGFPVLYGRHGTRKSMARLVLAHPKLLEGLVKAGVQLKRVSLLPAESGLRLKLGILDGETPQESSFSAERNQPEADDVIQYFSGCLAGYLQPSVAEASGKLCEKLAGRRPFVPKSQVCCGLASWSSGDIDQARKLAKKNIAAFEDNESPILTSCASCSSFLYRYPDLLADDPLWRERAFSFSKRVLEFSSFLLKGLQGRNLRLKSRIPLYYHEPCHLRFDQQNRQAAHMLIDTIQDVARLDTPDTWHCCGHGGLFSLAYPELAEKIFSKACKGLGTEKSSVVVTTCSGCLLQWQVGLASRGIPAEVRHFAVFLMENVCFDG